MAAEARCSSLFVGMREVVNTRPPTLEVRPSFRAPAGEMSDTRETPEDVSA